MESRRNPRAVVDPKVRQVGFFTSSQPDSTHPIASDSTSSPSRNSLSPVMIPPPPLHPQSLPLRSPTPAAATSPTASPGRVSRGSFSRSSLASSLPGVGMDSMAAATSSSVPPSGLTTVSVVNMPPPGLSEKTTKAERRALQEAQRAASKGASLDVFILALHVGIISCLYCVLSAEGGKAPLYDDESRVVKAKRRAVVKQTEAKNRVELFRHLPQYEHGTQLPDLETKFFLLDPMHPAVGLQYLSGDISGGNARCIAMLQAFQEVVKDYSTPPEKTLNRDLTAKISSYVSFLIECRPLSVSMGNAIRFVKNRIAKLPIMLFESEAKAALQSDIQRFISEKIVAADKAIVRHAVTKIRDGDVLLTYGSPSAVEMVLLQAHELRKKFRVLVVDSLPKLEGQLLLRRLIKRGIDCTYTHINAISYIMHEVTKVFLGASSVLSNGTVYSRVGTACVAMVASAFRVPVLVCCEAYKFHERVQLDSICSNELDGLTNNANLQFLNLMYDATPSDYISMIITDYGMVPPTSVPVIVREYQKKHLLV
ncbi:hypothetical protein F2Q69_00048501 [Brassica cretica]|uniref:Translation initiation factor eIF2B subunit delta n=1 Tax=Brassica cretica TaxID=69181 RepID=A0A8S9PWY2_BRACR|nr:hypothetical protein F2Q69_00048501 [Brassica cretica]